MRNKIKLLGAQLSLQRRSSDSFERHNPINDRNIFVYRLNDRAVISVRLIVTNFSSNRSIRPSNREARFQK